MNDIILAGSNAPLTVQSLVDLMIARQHAIAASGYQPYLTPVVVTQSQWDELMSEPREWMVELREDVYLHLLELRRQQAHFIARPRFYRPYGWRKRVRWIDKWDYTDAT